MGGQGWAVSDWSCLSQGVRRGYSSSRRGGDLETLPGAPYAAFLLQSKEKWVARHVSAGTTVVVVRSITCRQASSLVNDTV